MVNLFAADPRLYHTAGYGDSKRVLAKDKVEPTFFMIGRVTHSSLFDGMFSCEINIQPLAHTWPCQHAMLTQMLELNHVVVSSYKSGIQFSTARKPMSGKSFGIICISILIILCRRERDTAEEHSHGWYDSWTSCVLFIRVLSSVRSFALSEAIRPWNVDGKNQLNTIYLRIDSSLSTVPIFRGVQPFRLPKYTRLMMEYDKLSEGDFVIVAFTIASYKSKKKFNLALLNLQFIICVLEYGLDDTVEGPEPLPAYLVNETPLGVDKTAVMEVPVEELVFDSEVMVPGSEGMAMI